MPSRSSRPAVPVGALALISCLAANAFAINPLRPIALTGVEGPLGTGIPGVTFSSFGMANTPLAGPSLTGTNFISFAASLSGAGINADNNEALMVIRGHGLEFLARKGSQAAGLPSGVVYSTFIGEAALSDNGKSAFIGVVTGSGVDNFTNDCFWADPPTGGPLSLLVRENVTVAPGTPGTLFGDQANPGFPGPTMWGLWQPVMSVNGTVMQRCGISSPGNGPQWGIWYNPGGPLSSYYINCVDTLPGSNPARTFCGSGPWYINASGAILNRRSDSIDGEGLWSTRAVNGSGHGVAGTGPMHAVALAGQQAPGTVNTWDGFNNYSQNKNGRVAFSANFPGVPLSGGGLWSDGRFGVLQSVALTGGVAPGSTGTFHLHGVSMVRSIVIADNNSLTFHGRLWQGGPIGPNNDDGLWSNRALSGSNPVGNLRKVFIESDSVPTGLGPDYEGLTFLDPIAYWVNGTGRAVVFVNHNDFTRGLWIEQQDGSLLPIAKEFTFFDVLGDGTDMRLITSVIPAGGSSASGDGGRTAFNDNGDIVVRLAFSDGSEGIFTSAPPPTALCPADLDNDGNLSNGGSPDGGVDINDLLYFLVGFEAGVVAVDLDNGSGNGTPDGGVDINDLLYFLVRFEAGC